MTRATLHHPALSRPHPQPSTLGLAVAMLLSLLAGCSTDRAVRSPDVGAAMRAELAQNGNKPTSVPAQVSAALAEPAANAIKAPPEPKIDLLVNNAPARDVFLAIVADSRYSMLMHPDVSGTLSVTLRGVTVTEALESIRDVYGYDFKIDGKRITIYAPTLQTRIYNVNYPNSVRLGSSELSVIPGRSSNTSNASSTSSSSGTGSGATNKSSSGNNGNTITSTATSHITTNTQNDLWSEVKSALQAIVGDTQGRSVVMSPNAGIIAVRAMPEEQRQVDRFLRAMQLSIERQVMLEAKILEVELSDGFQSGINWSALAAPGLNALNFGAIGAANTVAGLANPFAQGSNIISGATPVPSSATAAGLFGLALGTNQFSAVLGFLETQGDVQTLSSPRVATLNNQKAVLKVGSDNYYVTAVTGGSSGSSVAGTGSTAATTTLPTIELSPFFSGISLDVTPQIDEANNVTLHVHPAITQVTEKTQTVGIGALGNYSLPVASSNVNETDTMVRIQDGQIVAIGGLMQLSSSRNQSGLPGTTGWGAMSSLFGNKATQGRKREVIVLIKPTIIRTSADWQEQNRKTRAALDDMDEARARLIKIDGGTSK